MLARWILAALCAAALWAQQGDVAFRGRVIDGVTGRGLENVMVVLRDLNAGKVLPSGRTNAKGEVSIPAKMGDYTVYLALDEYADTADTGANISVSREQSTRPLTMSMIRSGSISGVVEDAEGHPLTGGKVAVMEAVSTGRPPRILEPGPDGRFSFKRIPPGGYFLYATPPVVPVEYTGPEPGATFFPSSPDGWGAAQITVNAGIDVPNLRLRMRTAKYFTVSGKVMSADGVARGSVQLRREDNPRIAVPLDRNWLYESPISGDGAFSIEHVQEGAYVVKLLNSGSSSLPYGTTRVVVKDNIGDLRLSALPTGTLTWNIMLEDGTNAEASGISLQGWNEGPLNLTMHVLGSATPRQKKPTVTSIPVFSLKDVPAGAYRVSVPGFTVSKVQIGGQTYAGGKFEFAGRGATVVTVTVSQKGAAIQGAIEGTREPDEVVTGSASVAAISGFADHLPLLAITPLTDAGEFSFSKLEPGSYAVCAWTDRGERVSGLLRSGNAPVESLQPHCKTVALKADGSESVRLVQTSIEKVMR
jgi:hypothetical protein